MLLTGKVYLYNLKEERRVRSIFYANATFQKCDQMLKRAYFFTNPYRICKNFLIRKGATEIHAYGETPLTTWEKIAAVCSLKKSDKVFDLGCGRGRGVFFLSTYIGCYAQGIDWISHFIQRANTVKKSLQVERATFIQGDMCSADLGSATVIYLYGTCLDDDSLEKLLTAFKKLRAGTRILSVSYPLDPFPLLKEFNVCYPWGETKIYLHEV